MVAAFGRLPTEGVVAYTAFLDFESRTGNPFHAPPRSAILDGAMVERLTDEARELRWRAMLERVLIRWLVPLGGARVAELGPMDPAIGITPAGRYALGLSNDFGADALPGAAATMAAEAAAAPVIVQPNFEVVFLARSPAAEADIGRFAERTGQRVGTLFRITRPAVLAAAAAGVDVDEAVDALRRLSAQPLPGNVEHELRGWWSVVRHVRAEQTWVVRCPDEETAARVLAAAGKQARRLGPTAVELTDGKIRAALTRKLTAAGIFLERGSEAEPTKRRRGARRRGRY